MRILSVLFLMMLALTAPVLAADESEEGSKSGSGLPLPRFAALRSGEVNMRTGPGTRYPIDWFFTHQGLPVEITAEYDIWRRVRDSDGSEGWVHKTSLTGKRAAIVTGQAQLRELREDADAQSAILAHLEPGAIGLLMSCKKDWCRLKFNGIKGYLPKTEFWGAYPNEIFD